MRNKLRKGKCLKKDLGYGNTIHGPCWFFFLTSLIDMWLIYSVMFSGVQQ